VFPQDYIAKHNQDIDTLLRFFDDQAATTRAAIDQCTNPHLNEKPWRSQKKVEVEEPFAYIEQWREGKRPTTGGAPPPRR